MTKIGIEINDILRNVNKQLIKYYIKGIDDDFDEESLEGSENKVIDDLKFDSVEDKYNFVYIDYPYEIFGCAKSCSDNLGGNLNTWLYELGKKEDEDYEVMLFSFNEDNLTIQSTYFFLSKIGSRIREVKFPKDELSVWNDCDVIVTSNQNLIENKPNDKKVVLIEQNYTKEYNDKADINYKSLQELIDDTEFLNKIKK